MNLFSEHVQPESLILNETNYNLELNNSTNFNIREQTKLKKYWEEIFMSNTLFYLRGFRSQGPFPNYRLFHNVNLPWTHLLLC